MLSAIASASASAAACKTGKGIYQICVNGSAPTSSSTVEIAGTGATMKLNLEQAYGETTADTCATTTASGEFVVAPAASAKMRILQTKLHECALTGTGRVVKDCEISREESFHAMNGSLISPEGMYVGEGGTAFVEWVMSSQPEKTCGWPTQVITGEYECKFSEAKVEAVEHKMSCASTARYETRWDNSVAAPLTYTETVALTGAQKGDRFSFYEAA